MGADYSLEAVGEVEVILFNTSYLSHTKVLKILGLFDPEEFRYENLSSSYLKKVPEPSLWDYRDFLKAGADFIASAFYKSFILLKQDPSDKRWVQLYNEAEDRFGLIVNNLLIKVPDSYVRNQKGEVWRLVHSDLFFSELRKKVLGLAEEIPLGYREEFSTFFLPEELQKIILNPRVVFRPWVKIK
jgi:hypothetical protein